MTNKQILKKQYKETIKKDKELQFKISQVHNGKNGNTVSYRTIERWLNQDSDKLTTATTLKVIREHLSLRESEVLTEEEVTEAVQS